METERNDMSASVKTFQNMVQCYLLTGNALHSLSERLRSEKINEEITRRIQACEKQ